MRKNSAGEKAGLNVNDEIIAVDGYRFTENFLQTIMMGKKLNDQLRIAVNRNGIIREITIIIQITDIVNIKLTPGKEISEQQKLFYRRWLAIN